MRISEHEPESAIGYTLTELLVVLLILSIALTGSVMFSLGRFGEASMPRLASQIEGLLNSASTRSILTQKEIVVVIDSGVNEISTVGEDTIVVPATIWLETVTARSELLGGTRAGIRFFPEGGSTGGSIELSDERGAVLVDIDWLTGRVFIHEGNDDKG